MLTFSCLRVFTFILGEEILVSICSFEFKCVCIDKKAKTFYCYRMECSFLSKSVT